MLRISILILAVSLTCFQTESVDEKTALIEKLFELSKVEEITKASQLEGFRMGVEMSPGNIPDEKKAKMIAAGQKIMQDVMPWPEMKIEFIKLYDELYTAEELKDIVELCEDPRYELFVSKQIQMIGPAMKIGQKYGKRMMAPMVKETMKIMQEE